MYLIHLLLCAVLCVVFDWMSLTFLYGHLKLETHSNSHSNYFPNMYAYAEYNLMYGNENYTLIGSLLQATKGKFDFTLLEKPLWVFNVWCGARFTTHTITLTLRMMKSLCFCVESFHWFSENRNWFLVFDLLIGWMLFGNHNKLWIVKAQLNL